ncbi:MAG: 5-formyltetrahydrofolate cyclo-ligase, partial [Arcobacteraceae bacterium]
MSLISKADFRKSALKRLQFFSKIAKIKKNKKICLEIKKIIDFHKPKRILLYIPLNLEVDVMPIIIELRK